MADEKTDERFPEETETIVGKVKKIIGTSVFIDLDDYETDGVINFSEVAPGRIRNIRDYVKPGQKIVCKVLRVDREKRHIDLSLRRVSNKEKKDALEIKKCEKDAMILFNISIKDKERINKIFEKSKERNLGLMFKEFCEFAAEGNFEHGRSELEKLGLKENEIKEFTRLLTEKIKERKVIVTVNVDLTCETSDGIKSIRTVLSEAESQGAKTNYIGAPHYTLSLEDKNYKEANKKIKNILELMKNKAKSTGCKLDFKLTK